MKYYLITKRHESVFGKNWLLFWGPDNRGYTSDIRYAGIYDANDLVREDNLYPAYQIINSYIEFKKLDIDDCYIPVEVIQNQFKTFHLVEV